MPDEDVGAADRVTCVLDADGTVRQVIATDSVRIPSKRERCERALATI